MPPISIVVCLYRERDLLERLLQKTEGCYDDLVVVHDGPDETGIGSVVRSAGGRFFERPRAFGQEPHLPFAYEQAAHDWILHFDADEFPSDEMKAWLQEFRKSPEPDEKISAFTCIIPLWNGQRTVTKNWPRGHTFLFHRYRVRRFGMPEQAVVPEGLIHPVDFIIHHQPKRTTYGLRNILVRKQAYIWRATIARSLLGKPTDLPCWRWDSDIWPLGWEQIRQHPLRTGLWRLVMGTQSSFRKQWKEERRILFQEALHGPLHHFLLCMTFWLIRRRHLRKMAAMKNAYTNG